MPTTSSRSLGAAPLTKESANASGIRELQFLAEHEGRFLFGETVAAVVVLSRVRQSRPLKARIDVWRKACHELAHTPRVERLFELTNEGVLLPWQDLPVDRP